MLAEPREGVIRSRSQPITAGGSGERCKLLPTILVHLRLKRKHLVQYKSLFSENCSIIQK